MLRRVSTVSSEDLAKLVEKKLEKKGVLRYGITRAELARHRTKDDAWIAVHGKVYDITKHIEELEGSAMGKTSTLLAIFRVLGTDCTEEMVAVHSETAMKQLQGFMIGVLDDDGEEEDGEGYEVGLGSGPVTAVTPTPAAGVSTGGCPWSGHAAPA